MANAENLKTFEKPERILSPIDIYWVKRDGSKKLVCKRGDLVFEHNIERFPKLEFSQERPSFESEKLVNALFDLKSIRRPKERLRFVQNFRSHLAEVFAHLETIHPSDLVILSNEFLHSLPKEDIREFAKVSNQLFHRSCFIASMTVLGSVALGYASWPFINELWLHTFSVTRYYAKHGLGLTELESLESIRSLETEYDSKINFQMDMQVEFPILMDFLRICFRDKEKNFVPLKRHVLEMTDLERWIAFLQVRTPWTVDFFKDEQNWWSDFLTDQDFYIVNKVFSEQINVAKDNDYLEFDL